MEKKTELGKAELGRTEPGEKRLDKKELRSSIKTLREQLSAADKRDRDRRISERVAAQEAFQKAEKLLIYMHYGSEARTDDIINRALKQGKQVYVPKVVGKEMEFYQIGSLAACAPGYRGIPEPSAKAELYRQKSGKNENDDGKVLMILPGLVFDRAGNRIGYGGGFYDRYLERDPRCVKMGIAYDFQYVERVPAEETDIPVDYIVTDRQVVSLGRKKEKNITNSIEI